MLQFAHKTAADARATLMVVHQSILPLPAMGDSESLHAIRDDNRSRSLAALTEYVAETVGTEIPMEYEVTTGNLQAFLHTLEKSTDFDMIFVGMKHKGWLEKMLVGDTVTKVANDTTKIIVALPEGQAMPVAGTLYIAVKKEYELNETALHKCIRAFGNSALKIHVFSMLTPQEEEAPASAHLANIISGLPAEMHATQEVQHTENPHKHIKEFMRAHADGILVVQKGPRTLADIFRKYFVNDLVDDTQLPVIILP